MDMCYMVKVFGNNTTLNAILRYTCQRLHFNDGEFICWILDIYYRPHTEYEGR